MPTEIPRFPESRNLELADKSVFQKLYLKNQPEVSDLSFANLFAGRGVFGCQLSIFYDWLMIFSKKNNKYVFIPPIPCAEENQFAELLADIFKYCLNADKKVEFRAITEKYLAQLDKEKFEIFPERDIFDYVYSAKDLADLAGKRYAPKRNLISQFKKKYQYSYREISPEILESCLVFAEEWFKGHTLDNTWHLENEKLMLREFLNNFVALELFGGSLWIDERLVAMSIGSKLNPATFVVHIEKADSRYKGVYQVINQIFSQQIAMKYQWINREEDLDDPGLRKAKLSYYPEHFLHKYLVRSKRCFA